MNAGRCGSLWVLSKDEWTVSSKSLFSDYSLFVAFYFCSVDVIISVSLRSYFDILPQASLFLFNKFNNFFPNLSFSFWRFSLYISLFCCFFVFFPFFFPFIFERGTKRLIRSSLWPRLANWYSFLEEFKLTSIPYPPLPVSWYNHKWWLELFGFSGHETLSPDWDRYVCQSSA